MRGFLLLPYCSLFTVHCSPKHYSLFAIGYSLLFTVHCSLLNRQLPDPAHRPRTMLRMTGQAGIDDVVVVLREFFRLAGEEGLYGLQINVGEHREGFGLGLRVGRFGGVDLVDLRRIVAVVEFPSSTPGRASTSCFSMRRMSRESSLDPFGLRSCTGSCGVIQDDSKTTDARTREEIQCLFIEQYAVGFERK